MQILQPKNWKRPTGYSNGIAAKGKLVFVAGQVGWNSDNQMVGPGLVAQSRQALQNIVDIMAEAGAKPEHITRMDWFVVDVDYSGLEIRIMSYYLRDDDTFPWEDEDDG